MEVLTRNEIIQADCYTIEHENIQSFTLMERVALLCANRIIDIIPKKTPICIYCGQGNNGGDGLLIAKFLRKEGFEVEVFVIQHSSSPSIDFQRAAKEVTHSLLVQKENWIKPPKTAWIVDAIIGTGLKRPLDGFLADLVVSLNQLPNPILSIDLPSGLSCDGDFNGSPAIYARHTLSIQWPKLALLLHPQNMHTESFEVLNAGILNPELESTFVFLSGKTLAPLIQRRSTFSHKGHFGNLLILAGSKKYPGAASLCAHSALRSGAGKVSVCSNKSTLLAVRSQFPEAITLKEFPNTIRLYSSVLVGPGLDISDKSSSILRRALENFENPMVLDADAIRILATHKDWLKWVPKGSVFTPHLGEFNVFFGTDFSNMDGLKIAQDFCKSTEGVLVVKGPYTLICSPEGKVFFNSTGNPGLAKGGSGDVLAGLIAGLITRGYSSLDAAKMGVYIHGLSADLVASEMNVEVMLPSDIIARFSDAFDKVIKS